MVFESLFRTASKKRKSSIDHDNGQSSVSDRGPPLDGQLKRRKKRRRRNKNRNSSLDVEGMIQSDTRIPARADQTGNVRQRRGRPSEEALALSATLKEFSSQKRLDEALGLYWDRKNDGIRDAHHACIVVDCCARCGAIQEGEKIVKGLQRVDVPVNVETKTALLKGYAHSGLMAKASALFRNMCQSKDKRDLPNVRTLNTLLRGCLWTAADTDDQSIAGAPSISGGIVTAEDAWKLSKLIGLRSGASLDPDLSSYEYYITQLCHSFRADDAKRLIGEMRERFDLVSEEDLAMADPSSIESLAVSTMALTRVYAILGRVKRATKAARHVLSMVDSVSQRGPGKPTKRGKAGGKRAWRQDSPNQPKGVGTARRDASNAIFRAHRLSEVGRSAQSLLELCTSKVSTLPKPEGLAEFLATRVLYLSGGGTTDLTTGTDIDGCEHVASELMNRNAAALFHCFGLAVVSKHHSAKSLRLESMDDSTYRGLYPMPRSAVSAELSQLVGIRKSAGQPTDYNSLLTLPFGTSRRPILVELGSGSGDWIVSQAELNPDGDYVAVEMRSDRCAQTISNLRLNSSGNRLKNVYCVASSGRLFLKHCIPESGFSKIFVNHPEPPTQTFGSNDSVLSRITEGGTEPAHMLASDTLQASLVSLAPKGQLVVVSDNPWYGRLICATLVKVLRSNGESSSYVSESSLGTGYRQVEKFDGESTSDTVVLFEGQPSAAIGHYIPRGATGTGSSYFDRLWRSGGGMHAQRKSRYIIVIRRS